jgi:hypothetical protein
MRSVRGVLYTLARLMGDVNAVRRGRVGRRIGRRMTGPVTGRWLGRLWRSAVPYVAWSSAEGVRG